MIVGILLHLGQGGLLRFRLLLVGLLFGCQALVSLLLGDNSFLDQVLEVLLGLLFLVRVELIN